MRLRLWPLALAILTGSGCGPKPGAQTKVIRVTVTQGSLMFFPLYLAESLGFWRDEGLAVTMLEFPGNSKCMEALLSGSADVVAGFYEQTIQMAAEGRAIRTFVLMSRSPGMFLAVSPGTREQINRIEDLKGATVGITAPGSSTQFFLNYLLAGHGLSARDVSAVGVPVGAAQVLAMERGKVDACILTRSYFTMRKRNPGMRILADASTMEGVKQVFGLDGYPAAALLAEVTWLERNPDTADRMARAVLRTMRWMREHSPQEVLDKLPESLHMEAADADRQAIERVTSTLSPDGMISAAEAAGVQKVLSISLESVRKANVDLAKTYTNQYVAAK
jgi:NitT/TauT family transport system substrate-binding protein